MFSDLSRPRQCIPAGGELIYNFLGRERSLPEVAAPRRARPGRHRQLNTDIVPSINASFGGQTSPVGCDARQHQTYDA